MEKVVREDCKHIELWVTNADQQTEGFEEKLDSICRQNKEAGYFTIIYRSGSGSLYDCAEGLLLRNLNL